MYYVGMGKSQIRFTETFNVFRLRMIYGNMRRFQHLKFFSVEVCFFQTCKFVTLEKKHKSIIIVLE